MKAVHKYRLNTDGKETRINLKLGYKVVHSEYVLMDKGVFIWVEEPLNVDIPYVETSFKVVKSGDPLTEYYKHIASTIDAYAPEAYHIFQDRGIGLKAARVELGPKRATAA